MKPYIQEILDELDSMEYDELTTTLKEAEIEVKIIEAAHMMIESSPDVPDIDTERYEHCARLCSEIEELTNNLKHLIECTQEAMDTYDDREREALDYLNAGNAYWRN